MFNMKYRLDNHAQLFIIFNSFYPFSKNIKAIIMIIIIKKEVFYGN